MFDQVHVQGGITVYAHNDMFCLEVQNGRGPRTCTGIIEVTSVKLPNMVGLFVPPPLVGREPGGQKPFLHLCKPQRGLSQ